MAGEVALFARPRHVRACLKLHKTLTVRGPRISDEEDFESFIEYANRVAMDDAEFGKLKWAVDKYLPTKPLYVCTIKKSNIVKGKAKMYFSNRFTIQHILPNVKLPCVIKVISINRQVSNVKMVMSQSKVKGKVKGGAMLTSCWKKVVEKSDMKVGDIFVFWFRGSPDGLKLLVDQL